MEFKGSKGKWEVTFHKSLNDARELSCIQNENHDNLPTDLHIMNSYFIDYSEVQRANALLISKSPELLEMLRRCVNTLDQVYNCDMTNAKKLIKEATEL
jgi:hypothetical protein